MNSRKGVGGENGGTRSGTGRKGGCEGEVERCGGEEKKWITKREE